MNKITKIMNEMLNRNKKGIGLNEQEYIIKYKNNVFTIKISKGDKLNKELKLN